MTLSILYQDNALVAINKPSGLLVHRSPIDKTETRFAVQTLRDQLGRRVYPVHRLDKPTSGVLLFTFDAAVTAALGQQWQQVEKSYLAIVRGNMTSTYVNHPIRSNSETGGADKIQDAETDFKALAHAALPVTFGKRAGNYTHTTFSLVAARPKTGRKHQIRKHLKHLHHPIVGDTRYGRGEINRYFRTEFALTRLCLHCQWMRLTHPLTGAPLLLYAPLDSAWLRVLGRLSWAFPCST